jgi:parallel beta-helix repeat protein
VIRYNHLGPNPGHAGIVIDGGSPQIVGNTIEGCAAGIALISPPDDPVIEGNTFLNNEEDIVRRY